MLIDAAKGVEAQTRKLFEVCRLRHIPIFTFVNKMDRQGREPLDLLSEIEEVLGIDAVPDELADRHGQRLRRRLRPPGPLRAALLGRPPRHAAGGRDARRRRTGRCRRARRDGTARERRDATRSSCSTARAPASIPISSRAGSQTPTFFGSALTNYGVLPFLDRFLDARAAARPAHLDARARSIPSRIPFSGFVFKIQANMDPDHRDRVAFLRVCSGHFVRGETAMHVRTGKPVRLTRSTLLQAQEREIVEEAFPGDVVGLFDPGIFRIGDTLSDEGDFAFDGIPSFSPEHFARVEVALVLNRKALAKGLSQLVAGRRRAGLHGAGIGHRGDDPRRGRPAPVRGAAAPAAGGVRRAR